MAAVLSSHASTDSLDSLVLHDSTSSPNRSTGQGASASNPDMEQELIAAAEALLTGQVAFQALLLYVRNTQPGKNLCLLRILLPCPALQSVLLELCNWQLVP